MLQSGWKKHDIPNSEKGFQVPYLNSRYFLPIIWTGVLVLLFYWNRVEINTFFTGPPATLHIPDPGSRIPHLLVTQFPILIFIISAAVVTWFGIRNELSLIPVLGLLTNFYLMAQLGVTNWMRFLVWLAIGLVIYFSYGRMHSKLKK